MSPHLGGEVLELVEQAVLENRCTLTGTVDSNPTLSGKIVSRPFLLGYDKPIFQWITDNLKCIDAIGQMWFQGLT